jgi:aspartokinase
MVCRVAVVGIASRMFDTLCQEGTAILMISTFEIRVWCVMDRAETETVGRALEEGPVEAG